MVVRGLKLPLGGAVAACLTFAACGGVSVDSSRSTGDAGTGRGGAGGAAPTAGTGGAEAIPDAGQPDATTPDAMPEGPHSGSRLRVRGWSVGAVVIPGGALWDQERGIQCFPGGSVDGQQRCLPGWPDASVFFTDAECTEPVVVWTAAVDSCGGTSEVPRYAVERQLARCQDRELRVFEVGEPVPPPPAVYGASELGCGVVANTGSSFYQAIPSPSTEWVRLDREVTEVTPRLGVAYWNGEDGSRIFEGLRLLPEDVPCTEQQVSPGAWRCLPRDAMTSPDYFEGDSCGRPVALTFSCEPPQLIRDGLITPTPTPTPPTDECDRSPPALAPAYRAVKVESSLVYASTGDASTCAPTEYLGFDYYRMGDLVPYEEFPVVESLHAGTGAFEPVYAATEGHKLFVRPGELFDAEAKAMCRAERLQDERMFCVSNGALLPSFYRVFEDARCEVPVLALLPCDAPQARAVYGNAPDAACALQPLFRVGARRARGPAQFHRADAFVAGLCGPASQETDLIFHDLGEEVDPADVFPELKASDL